MPLFSRLGCQPTVDPEPRAAYEKAAQAILEQLESICRGLNIRLFISTFR